jgi:hypothetical protein
MLALMFSAVDPTETLAVHLPLGIRPSGLTLVSQGKSVKAAFRRSHVTRSSAGWDEVYDNRQPFHRTW